MTSVLCQHGGRTPDIGGATLGAGVTVELATSLGACEALWREFETASIHYIFQKFEWQQNFMETIGAKLGLTPIIVTVRDATGRLVMLWPLAMERRGPLLFLVPLGGDVTDYHAPMVAVGEHSLVTADVVFEIMTKIRREIGRYDVVELDKIPALIENYVNPLVCIPNIQSNGKDAHAARLGVDFETWVKTRRSSRSLRDERRKKRRLSEIGGYSEILNDHAIDPRVIFDALVAQKSRRWRETGQIDLFQRQCYRDFYWNFFSRRALNAESHISALIAGGHIVACHWGLLYRSRFYYILLTFEVGEFERFSPGSLLITALLRWCSKRNIGLFDFTIGDDLYKNAWCDVTLPLYRYIQPATISGRCYIILFRLVELARGSATIRKLVRALRTHKMLSGRNGF